MAQEDYGGEDESEEEEDGDLKEALTASKLDHIAAGGWEAKIMKGWTVKVFFLLPTTQGSLTHDSKGRKGVREAVL